jgi:hypothetical protein
METRGKFAARGWDGTFSQTLCKGSLPKSTESL